MDGRTEATGNTNSPVCGHPVFPFEIREENGNFSEHTAQTNVKTRSNIFASHSERPATMIARFFWGASLAYTATVRPCILLAALIAAAAIIFGGASAHAGIGKMNPMDAQAQALPSALHVAHKPINAKKPCKRHKAYAHHDCHVCLEHVSVAPASRTRPSFISPKIKLVVADTLADRLAQAEAQASAQLILADSESYLLRSVSAGVIARTGRLRN